MLNISQQTRARYPNLTSALYPEPISLEAAILKAGKKLPGKARPASWHASRVCMQADRPKVFPDPVKLQHQIMIERQGPLFVSYYDDDGVSGLIYSSRGLTDWYVDEFCRINHLVR